MRAQIIFVVFWIMAVPGWAQLDNRIFEDRMTMEPADSGNLYLGLKVLGFGKNNEYFHAIIEGYTLLGYQLNPYLSYHLAKNIRLDGGIYLQKDFGNSRYSTIVPTLSLKINQGHFSFLFGNLESSLNHRLIEPLYDFERVLNNRMETGVQMLFMRDDLFVDVWVDWQKMIYNNDPNQEHFVSGLSFNKRITNGAWKLFVPIQVVVSHRGGQINANPPPLETKYNAAIGLEVQHPGYGAVTNWIVNGYYAYYNNVSSVLETPYRDGSGYYFNATAATKFGLDIMMTYWQGHEFMSVEGGKIYPSVSFFDPTIQREQMKLVKLRFLYHRQLMDGLTGGLRFQPYYDLGFEQLEYSYGLYLQFNDRFFLAKRKKG